jgi:hypothetical protein
MHFDSTVVKMKWCLVARIAAQVATVPLNGLASLLLLPYYTQYLTLILRSTNSKAFTGCMHTCNVSYVTARIVGLYTSVKVEETCCKLRLW